MEQLVLIIHILIAVAIIGLILIQQGKGADVGASFGGGASQTLFGGSGSGNALTKTTSLLAALFFASSFTLAVMAKNNTLQGDDIDLPLPAAVQDLQQMVDDIPVVEDNSASSPSDIPGGAAGSDIPDAPRN